MNLLVVVLVTTVSAAAGVVGLLAVRRRAPEGSYFQDGDRAAGVFGVLATGFSVLLGFIVFLAFTSYDDSRAGAEQEALVVAQQFETSQYVDAEQATELSGELICYARYVVHHEWPRLEAGKGQEAINVWASELFRTLRTVQPGSDAEASAFDHLLDQTSDREEARNERIHGAEGIIPGPLWVVLFAIAALIVVFMLFFADSAEPAIVQGLMMAVVVGGIVLMMFVIAFLNDPFGKGYGSLQPVAMERTLVILHEEMDAAGAVVTPPCDDAGVATGSTSR